MLSLFNFVVVVVVILQWGCPTSESDKWPAIAAVAIYFAIFFILATIRFLVFESQRLASQLVVKWLLNITMCRKICTSPDLNPRPLGSARRQHRSQTLTRLYYTPTHLYYTPTIYISLNSSPNPNFCKNLVRLFDCIIKAKVDKNIIFFWIFFCGKWMKN